MCITESHRPQVPGVTELVVHDLLTQPSVVVPHKSSNQKRLAYTITVTSVQKVGRWLVVELCNMYVAVTGSGQMMS